MKAAAVLTARVASRLERTWHRELAGDEPAWPYRVPVGRAAKETLEGDFARAVAVTDELRRLAAGHGLELVTAPRRVHGTSQQIPTNLVVPTIDAAAALAGGSWPATLARGRRHARVVAGAHPAATDPAAAVRELARMSDRDVELAFTAARWFTGNAARAAGYTPRQVPIEGLHAKWLNQRQRLVANLAGLDDLGLLPGHPQRVHLTYLDPGHRAAGGRRHDCVSVGDRMVPPYPVRVVLISENKDTAVAFPPVTGGVAVEGEGRGAGGVAAVGWLAGAEHVVYWGDMDQDGLEILNEYRAAGVSARSLLMDLDAYERYRRWGSGHDRNGVPLAAREARPVPHLEGGELDLYRRLSDHAWTGPRRVEQERIPLAEAVAELGRVAPDAAIA